MYTTDRAPSGSGSAPTGVSSQLLNRLFQTIERTTHKDPHPGFIIATHHFKDPYPMVNEIDLDLLCNATMDLLIQFAYPSLSGYGKFTISYTISPSYGLWGELTFTLDNAIPLTDQDNKKIPMNDVYALIYKSIQKYAERYDGQFLVRLMIRVYDGRKEGKASLLFRGKLEELSSIMNPN
ncbi:UNVERIFIED_CONTAM: hypothetical protein Scaly_2840700 [Sesamum calycinum]|uniref:Uncharacterized protein n=1 Tax=Sesamum calycinum TaxID=2727403 RepID=A0AAW2IRN5_9LAMI